jgi:hypothetical protein
MKYTNINVALFVTLLLTTFVRGEDYEDTFTHTIYHGNEINAFVQLEHMIASDTELTLCGHYQNGINSLKALKSYAALRTLQAKISGCYPVISGYKEAIAYYQFLTKDILPENFTIRIFTHYEVDLLLKRQMDLKRYPLSLIKYNLVTNGVLTSIANAQNNQMEINRLLDEINLKYIKNQASYGDTPQRGHYEQRNDRDEHNNNILHQNIFIDEKSLLFNSETGVHY